MAQQSISARLDVETQRQLTALETAWGSNTTNSLVRCIRETYRTEVERLSLLRTPLELDELARR